MARLERYGNVPRLGQLVTYNRPNYFMEVYGEVENVYYEKAFGAVDIVGWTSEKAWRDVRTGKYVPRISGHITWSEAVPVRLIDYAEMGLEELIALRGIARQEVITMTPDLAEMEAEINRRFGSCDAAEALIQGRCCGA